MFQKSTENNKENVEHEHHICGKQRAPTNHTNGETIKREIRKCMGAD